VAADADLGVPDMLQRPPQPGNNPHGYTIAQATSDGAQLHTIAFDALAFLTGDFGCDTFLPPGKISDFFGFQYMRDIDVGQMGHNTSFLSRIANDTLSILSADQKAQLVALGELQAPVMQQVAVRRFALIQAFRRNLAAEIPTGSKGLDRAAIMKYTSGIFEISGQLAFQRAQTVGKIARSLTEQQKTELAKLKFGDSSTWPELPEAFDKRTVSHEVHVAVETYASEFFSWYAGSVDADTYFCPEGHGTYFGSFFMKDAPAVRHDNYSISTSITGDSGQNFLDVLTPAQQEQITGLVDLQRSDLQGIVQTRRAIATELRRFLIDDSASIDKVLSLCRHYGELDGELSYFYATHFAEVNKTLTPVQRAALVKLRGLENYKSPPAFIFADAVDLPKIQNTDFLFGVSN
jgi:Spy/CpxP family protein refolding chaperone